MMTMSSFFGRPFVKRFALCYQTIVLSVCLVCDVGVLSPNGWTDQDETWRAGRPRPWPHCVRWGPGSPSPKGAQPPIFRPYLLRLNGCIDQDATWYGGRPASAQVTVFNGDPATPRKKGHTHPTQFLAYVYCSQMAGWIKMPIGTAVNVSSGDVVLDGAAAPP